MIVMLMLCLVSFLVVMSLEGLLLMMMIFVLVCLWNFFIYEFEIVCVICVFVVLVKLLNDILFSDII